MVKDLPSTHYKAVYNRNSWFICRVCRCKVNFFEKWMSDVKEDPDRVTADCFVLYQTHYMDSIGWSYPRGDNGLIEVVCDTCVEGRSLYGHNTPRFDLLNDLRGNKYRWVAIYKLKPLPSVWQNRCYWAHKDRLKELSRSLLQYTLKPYIPKPPPRPYLVSLYVIFHFEEGKSIGIYDWNLSCKKDRLIEKRRKYIVPDEIYYGYEAKFYKDSTPNFLDEIFKQIKANRDLWEPLYLPPNPKA